MQISQRRFDHAILKCVVLVAAFLPLLVAAGEVVDLGSRRELFVDRS